MEDQSSLDPSSQRTWRRPHCKEQGFALVSLVLLLPLLLSLLIGVGGGLYILKRKALAQSLCVRRAVQMQNELRLLLTKLLNLNRKARQLRRARESAESALQAAIASGVPAAIAVAKAVRMAVILQQTALRTHQEQLLKDASLARRRYERQLRQDVRPLRVFDVRSHSYYPLALAVRPEPANSLTPDYKPVTRFSHLQQHRFSYPVNLAPEFARSIFGLRLPQTSECSATVENKTLAIQKEPKWNVRILTASARSR